MHLDLKDHVTRLTYFALNLLDEIQTSPHEVDAKECRGTCLELLRAFDHAEARRETFQLAQYALTAWIDDLLCREKWRYAAAWRNHPLEQELFGTTCRHWRFFEQAELALRRQDWDALLVFQFCVEFGFRGIYAKDRVKVRLNDRLPMTRARAASQARTPLLAGVLQEDASGHAVHFADYAGTGNDLRQDSLPSFTQSSEPVLPPTLAEWSRRTFSVLEKHAPSDSAPRSLFGQILPAGKLLTDWAIVMAVGLLLFAVLFAMGH